MSSSFAGVSTSKTKDMSIATVGWIGLGNMGIPMVKNLIKEGFAVTVYNRTKQKEEQLKALGAATAATPAELLQHCDTVILMVSDDAAVRDVFTGPHGLLHTIAKGKIVVNMSTVSPGISREMASLCVQQGMDYLDAPVAGSVKPAEEGQLVIMVGGEQASFEKLKPVFACLGKTALHVGSYGAGNNAKLAINSLLGFTVQGLAEAVLLARKNGLDTKDILTLINESALSNGVTKIKSNNILQDNYTAAFALKHLAKDLRLAKNEGLNTPLGNAAVQTFQQAEAAFGEEDAIAILKQLVQ